MYTAILWALAVAATPSLPLAIPAHCSVQASVEGFSGNEAALAVRERVTCRHGSVSDRFTLIELFDLASQQQRATFALGEVTRYDARGHRVFVAPRLLKESNPSFAHARRDWGHWAAQGHLGVRRYDFEETLVRFAFADGAEGEVDVRGQSAVLSGRAHRPLAAQVVARLSDGRTVEVGRVQALGEARPKLSVDVYYSPAGRSVAVVAHSPHGVRIEARRLPDQGVLGTHKLGAPNRMFDFSRVLMHDFARAHPDGGDDWDHWVHSGI